jgi:hypothetical protein
MSTDALETTAAKEANKVAPCLIKEAAMRVDEHTGRERELLLKTWQVCYDCPEDSPNLNCPGYNPKTNSQY